MKFDNIVIGGGLSGLVSAIESVRAGCKTAMISTGQSALHFWSGSFELLGSIAGKTVVDSPLKRIGELPDNHPYNKIGEKRLTELLGRVTPILEDAGIKVSGDLNRNHWRLTPLGFVKPAWLTLDDYVAFDNIENFP